MQPMSAIGPKRTSLVAPHMSAFGGKADMALCRGPLSWSLLGAKRTCPFALHTSANDPKRTLVLASWGPPQTRQKLGSSFNSPDIGSCTVNVRLSPQADP